jgi:hypothetical protein
MQPAASLLRHLGIERADFFGYGNGGESAAGICGLQAEIAGDKF